MTAHNTPLPPAPRHPSLEGDVVVHVFGRTDVGRTREHHEEAFVVADLTAGNATLQPEVRRHVAGERGTLFMVADGMGGAAAGEIASAMAIEIVLEELQTNWVAHEDPSPESFARALRRAATRANAGIHAFALEHPEYRGMGTTATIAGLLGDTLYVAQVGDSRAYIVRDGVARQITKDQSLIQKLVEAGEITEAEAETSERRNIILQALGPEAVVKVDLTHQQLRAGDALVLCSDGLSGQVSRDEIAKSVTGEADLVAACKRLIDRANETGGPDNITVIVARFEGTALTAAADVDGVGHRVYPLPDTGQTPAMRRGSAEWEDTLEMPAQPRPVAQSDVTTPTAPVDGIPVTPPMRAGVPLTPELSAARKRRGMIVAAALLALLISLGAWYVLHTAKKVAPGADAPRNGVPDAGVPAAPAPQ